MKRKVQSSGSQQILTRNQGRQNYCSIQSANQKIKEDIFSEEGQSKLPQLSELINLKLKQEFMYSICDRPQDKDLHQKIIEMVKYIQDLENEIKMKNKQIERLEYMIKFFSIGQQKRDIMVQLIQDENRKLKENYHNLQQQLHKEQSQKSFKNTEIKQNNNSLQQPTSIQQTSSIHKPLLLRTRTREIQDDIAQGLLSLSIESLLQIQQRYQQIPHIDPLNAILANSYDRFEKNIQIMNTAQMTQFFDALHSTLNEHKQLFQLVARLRLLHDTSIQLSQQPSLKQALEIVIHDTCEVLDADRASVFVYDPEKEQLWTRVLKGQQIIRIPYNKGIAGYVFTTGELLNVMNAYSDPRFEKDADKANNYRTNTILAIPIMDPDKSNTIGVLQAVNKMQGYFTKDDEKIIELISSFAGVSLKNALQFDESIVYHNSLRNLLSIQNKLCSIQNVQDLLKESENQLKELFNVQHARIYAFVDSKNMIRYDNTQFLINQGLIGEAIKIKQLTNTFSPYQSQLFNKQVDIETTLPLYSFPIKNPYQTNEYLGALQVINSRAIQSVSTQQQHKIAQLDTEILNHFGQFFGKKLLSIQ